MSIEQHLSLKQPDGSTLLGRVFGVRHLSPAGAIHLRTVLDELQPTAVLVEGPSDATELIKHLVRRETKPPVALLAYTKQRPIRSILYPLAGYSPEWIALTWGLKNGADVRFIDLPSSIFLQWHQPASRTDDLDDDEVFDQASPDDADVPHASEHTRAYLDDPYAEIAKLSGDPDHETWWERRFEHTIDPISYILQIREFGKGLRELRNLKANNENLVREAYMRRCIHDARKKHQAEKILIVCGAFHSSALTEELSAMTDKEFKALPTTKVSLTLMPYSYFRLSSQSGYGAGNHAPLHYQRIYDTAVEGERANLPVLYATEMRQALARQGLLRSSAEAIEAVRLSQSLAALAESSAPTLRDLRDAAVTCLGRGEPEVLKSFLKEIEIGTRVGKLPKDIIRTSIQDDFYLQLEELYLDRYQTEELQILELDLRENRTVKSKEAAFRDLARSTFLHRLAVLNIHFGTKQASGQDQATWKEIWHVRWTPDSEIQLVEASLIGDTVEVATAVRIAQQLTECRRIDEAARVCVEAVNCGLHDALEHALRRLQGMAVDADNFIDLASAITSLAEMILFGSVRRFDPSGLQPLLTQLFLRAVFAARTACLCDEATAREQVRPAFAKLHDVTQGELRELLDIDRWNHELDLIATSDNLNAYLSGFTMGLILPRTADAVIEREISRRLSPGMPPDLAAEWFEGLVQGNREMLFARRSLWARLDEYVVALDAEAFRRALVALRRAFSNFTVGQVRRVVGCLVEACKTPSPELLNIPEIRLSEEETKQLAGDLSDLDLSF